ncbi:MAG: type IV pilus modification protein PilV, partial [Gammaproteobacteria bacterium]|nr:type IV pilus modification protein PilV [Gammaproteobacteria bacterium]
MNMINKQIGVGMIEVLVAIVITAVGLLGVAKMQSLALQSNHDASQRSMAIYFTEDIISRIRSVPQASLASLASYDDTIVGYKKDTTEKRYIPLEPTPVCDLAYPCDNFIEKFNHDLWEWEQLLDGEMEKSGATQVGGLFNANGCIAVSNNQVTVIVAWDAIDNAAASTSAVADACG